MSAKPLNAREGSSLAGKPSFALGNRVYRATWILFWWLLASWTPPPLHPWRRLVLLVFGARIARSARVYGSVRIWDPRNLVMHPNSVLGPRVNCYCMGEIIVGEESVVSQGAHLCAGTHDINDPCFQLITKTIAIGKRSWIASEAFIGPGVSVGEGAVIGARAVLFKDAEAFAVYIGNPAIRIKRRMGQTSGPRNTA